jgi:hypothetical protein
MQPGTVQLLPMTPPGPVCRRCSGASPLAGVTQPCGYYTELGWPAQLRVPPDSGRLGLGLSLAATGFQAYLLDTTLRDLRPRPPGPG